MKKQKLALVMIKNPRFEYRTIGHVVCSIDNPAAGTTYCVKALCQAIAEAGFQVNLASQITRSEPGIKDRIPGVILSEFPVSPYLGRLGRRLGYSRALFEYCKANQPSLLHLHGMWMLPNIIPGLIAIKRNTPYIVSPHGSLGIEALKFSRKKKRIALSMGQGKVVLKANCLHATALSEAEAIRSFGLKQPIALIPNGIDIPNSSASLRSESIGSKYVLWLGRVHPVKGLPNLLRAWSRQAPNFPDWTLRLVGPDQFGHKNELRRIIEELQVPRVSIEDPAFGDDKAQLMANAGLFVLPSLVENFAMTVAESLAFGVPVISSKGAPWSGLADNRCGWWVDGTIEGLSSVLGAALSLPASERHKMGQRGHEWMARDFGWEGIGRRMGAVYDWVLGKGDVTDDIIFG